MNALTTEQYKAVIDVHRDLVGAGLRPDVASHLVRRATDRALEAGAGCSGAICCPMYPDDGLGKVHQLRRIEHTPDLAPRYTSPADRCVRIEFTPGDEERLRVDIQQYQDRGWNVMQVAPFKGHDIWYACPPGQLPMEQQPLFLKAKVE